MFYTDVHSHILSGVDDGPKTPEEMYALLDASYADGVRTLCLTPHLHPVYYGHNQEKAKRAFALLSAYASEKYPDMTLHLACELGYHTECLSLLEGNAECLVGGKYVLLDFMANVSLFTLRYAIEELLSVGYLVLLAHVERYECLYGKEALMREWAARGVRFQVNAVSFLKEGRRSVRRQIKKLMRYALIHIVASDVHDLVVRKSVMREAEAVISARYGHEIAELLMYRFPNRILAGKHI